MFGKFSYLFYMLVFTLIPIGMVWIRHYHALKKNIYIILITVFLAVVYQLISDPFAAAWKAWSFNKDKTLGIWLLGFPIEDMLFAVLVATAISSSVIGFLCREQRKKSSSFKQ